MDDIKDSHKTDNLSRFIDGPIIKTNPFGNNRAGERAYRRAERIAAALHLLTNHIPATEPIRTTIRTEAVQLLDCSLALRDEMRATLSGNFQAFEARIRSLISLVRILTVSGFVSMQNANTMIESLDELGTFLTTSQRSALSESVTITKEELTDIGGPYPVRHTRAVKDIRDTHAVKDNGGVSDRSEMSVKTDNPIGQSSIRAGHILDVLGSGSEMGIRDIAANLPEYSEKMIQRELLELVSKGRVNKVGLKRWSRYSIARS